MLGLHWGIAGSAWGTVIAQIGAGRRLPRRGGARRAAGGDRPAAGPAGIRAAAFAGASLVLRTLALQAVLVLMTAIAARQSDAAIAAHQVAMRIWNLLRLRARRDRDRRAGHHRPLPRRGDVAAAAPRPRRMIAWGAGYGALFSVVLLAIRPGLPGLFGVTPHVRGLLLAVLLVVIVQQPVAGVVFVLDGVLIGAGDQDYLAVAGLVDAGRLRRRRRDRGQVRRRAGRALARLYGVDAGQVRHPDAAGPQLPWLVTGRRAAVAVGTRRSCDVSGRAPPGRSGPRPRLIATAR